MAGFLSPFVVQNLDRPMNERELCRAIRQSVAAEEEAIHLYEAYADACEFEKAREVFQDIANEEKVHVGEFQELLKHFADDEEKFLEEGEDEVEEMFEGKSETAAKIARITERLLTAVDTHYKEFTYFSNTSEFQIMWFFRIEQGDSLVQVMRELNDWKKEILSNIREAKSKIEGFKVTKKLSVQYTGNNDFLGTLSFKFSGEAGEVADELSGIGFRR